MQKQKAKRSRDLVRSLLFYAHVWMDNLLEWRCSTARDNTTVSARIEDTVIPCTVVSIFTVGSTSHENTDIPVSGIGRAIFTDSIELTGCTATLCKARIIRLCCWFRLTWLRLTWLRL